MEMGWGLKTTKKTERFLAENKQPTYSGIPIWREETSNKVDANNVAKNMRREKDVDGKRMFSIDEFLTACQISSFFFLSLSRSSPKETETNTRGR